MEDRNAEGIWLEPVPDMKPKHLVALVFFEAAAQYPEADGIRVSSALDCDEVILPIGDKDITRLKDAISKDGYFRGAPDFTHETARKLRKDWVPFSQVKRIMLKDDCQ